MESTSNTTHGEPDNSDFDLDHGLTTDTALRREVPPIYKYLADLKLNSPSSPNSVDGSRAHRTAGFEGWVLGGQKDTNYVPMQLLSLPEQEENDLQLLYPEAKVQTNYITTEQYLVVVKLFLFNFKVSGKMDHPQAYARLLSRLSRELRSVPTGGFKLNCLSDPANYDACLGEMINDIEMTWRKDGEILQEMEETWSPDGCVYVSSGIDNYVQCLLAAATELSSC